MATTEKKPYQVNEDRIALLTDTAYQAILQRGFRGSFLELELSLWNAIRGTFEANAKLAPLKAV